MEQYIREEEEFVEKLKSLGRTFGDDLEALRSHYFIKGLHSRYESQASLYEFMEKSYDDIISQFRSLALQKEGKKIGGRPEANASASAVGQKQRKKKGPGGAPKAVPRRCYKCGELGHLPSVCSVTLPLDSDNKPMSLCFFCKGHGHMAADCPKRGEQANVPTK
jgi:hypothetical protein